MKKFAGLTVLGLLSISAMAQKPMAEKDDNGINPLSLRPVEQSKVMYKTTVWRRVDLREKINQPFFAKNAEITKHLIDGVKAGVLDAYENDSLNRKLTLAQFSERLTMKGTGSGLSQAEIDAGFGADEDGWTGGSGSAQKPATQSGDDGWGDSGSTAAKTVTPNPDKKPNQAKTGAPMSASRGDEMFPSQLYLLEIREDWIFDKQRSRQYNDIQTITIVIPAEMAEDGLQKDLATFKYKDLDTFFRSNPNCIWYNTENTAEHKNIADALELRLFNGRIVRTSDPGNRYLEDIYKSPKAGLLQSQNMEYKLMEKEHNLWEY